MKIVVDRLIPYITPLCTIINTIISIINLVQ
jgi:hypothetical protein